MAEKTLKEKTVGALLWNLVDRLGQQILMFVLGILVANILSVEDYALVGMLAIFTAIANIVLESGFSSALIQKKDANELDFNSVFFFNMGISVVLYLLLVACSPLIAMFFHQPKLTLLAPVIFFALLINSFSIVQTTILNKKFNFKALAKVNVVSVLVSGISSLVMALLGFGVWTLALQPVVLALCRTIMLWLNSSWRPKRQFSWISVRGLFRYASSLLGASLINTCFLNVYSLIIGRIYPVKQLGYYTQGNKMCDMGVATLYGSIQNATFPIFSSIQDEGDRLIRAYRKTVRFTAFITFPALIGLIVIAPALIKLLLKAEWWPCIPFFQLMCAGGCFTIFTAINNNFIKVSGRSEIIFKIELYKIVVTVVFLLLTFHYSVLVMVAGQVVARAVIYIINVLYSDKYTGYSFGSQVLDLLPYLGLSLLMGGAIWAMRLLIINSLFLMITQIIVGGLIYIILVKLSGSKLLDEALGMIFKNK